ncbi:MAG: NUDIX hydrolase [Clostridia bacterium]|nr:NUDIX hydrolase [Clostridia bacterium]
MDTLTEKTLSQTTAFQGRLLRLRVDEVRLPDGSTAGREVVEHPGGVAVLALTDTEEVLLVRQFRYPYGEILTEIPAGKREAGEEPLVTGMRELAEETGYRADNYTFLGTLYPTPGYCDEVIYLYMATDLHLVDAHPDEDEFLEVGRMPLAQLVDLVLDNRIPDAKTQTAALKAWCLLKKRKDGN